jgi:hypothetical protein
VFANTYSEAMAKLEALMLSMDKKCLPMGTSVMIAEAGAVTVTLTDTNHRAYLELLLFLVPTVVDAPLSTDSEFPTSSFCANNPSVRFPHPPPLFPYIVSDPGSSFFLVEGHQTVNA